MQIKRFAKQILLRFGLWYPLDAVRRIPDTIGWLGAGCTGCAPHPIKRMVIASYLKHYAIDLFVETGTYLGETVSYVANKGVRCVSIELSPELYRAACARLESYTNVKLVCGDSAQRLPETLSDINEPTLFWLDGHYSSGITASAETHTPISAELRAILRHAIKRHVILIDDAHCFDGTNNYPHIDELLHVVREDGSYSAEISLDIVRLIPLVMP